MTVEELREEFGNLGFFYPYSAWEDKPEEYKEWLEQKLTQPCPECEKHKAIIEKLITEASRMEICPKADCHILCDMEAIIHVSDCEACWRKWAYEED